MKRLNWRAVETLGLRVTARKSRSKSASAPWNSVENPVLRLCSNITERKRAERELRENKEQFGSRAISSNAFSEGRSKPDRLRDWRGVLSGRSHGR